MNLIKASIERPIAVMAVVLMVVMFGFVASVRPRHAGDAFVTQGITQRQEIRQVVCRVFGSDDHKIQHPFG